MANRFAYTLLDLRKQELDRAYYEIVHQLEVDPADVGLEALAKRLTAWAMEILRAEVVASGMYSAELSTLDEQDEPDTYIYAVTICQNGSDQVVTWPDPRGFIDV
ncbi:hypothetical protein KIPE111705_18500 [Kibdelosporangium persicum]|uniref:Uncharacterized protein n=1 Tax=Kibdelosporangium persicum TaxID=2698649 RepID=A0ABX2FEE7_9PSEU|nr:hypothetical protein [Kibdelosporangium persicum]NRN69754.1 hypothetical protein [Kibdelosporangium persicum]